MDDIIDFLAVFPQGTFNNIKKSISDINDSDFIIILRDYTTLKLEKFSSINLELINELITVINIDAKRRLILLLIKNELLKNN
jgi:hypothetical protein